MIRGIHHVALSTANIDKLAKFYKDAFGFEVVWESAWEAGNQMIDDIVGLKQSSAKQVMLKAGNTHIEVFQYLTPEGAPVDPNRPVCDEGYTHFCVDVTDIDYEYNRLKDLGMTFHCPPPSKEELGEGPIRATYGRDPDGNVIEIQEILDKNFAFYLEV